MEIKYKNYTAKESDGRFDLSFTTKIKAKEDTIHRKKGDEYEIETVVGFGYTFETLIRRIIENELSQNNEVMSLKEYINEFKELKNEITNILN